MSIGIRLAEGGWVPDFLVRRGIRGQLGQRRREIAAAPGSEAFLADRRGDPLALAVHDANRQHYEVPADFYRLVLGPRLKYSCCLFEDSAANLARAEAAMLDLTCRRAGLAAGQDILELGCGWGSLSLWMAEKYPASRITAVSNSRSQKAFIDRRAEEKGLTNLEVVTCDMNDFAAAARYDRVVSVEMFEHMRNWEALLARIAGWLHDDGCLFVHVFCHRSTSYLFETRGEDDWMARHFFTGGIMPADDLLPSLDRDLRVLERWRVEGTHYARTAEAWLHNLDAQRAAVEALFVAALGRREGRVQVRRWRMFFLAVAELFGWGGGREWYVAHYLLGKRA